MVTGRRAALVSSAGEPGAHQIYASTRTSDSLWGSPRRLTERPEGRSGSPRWSPDGRLIAFKDHEGIWVTPAERGEPRRIHGYKSADEPRAEVLQWSPDGRTIYFTAFDPAGRSVIAGVPAAGGAVREVVRFDDPLRQSSRPEFATDGQFFFFTIGTRVSDVWEMALDRH